MIQTFVFAENDCLPFVFRQRSVRIFGRMGGIPPPLLPTWPQTDLGNLAMICRKMSLINALDILMKSLQVLKLKPQTKAVSRARTGCGSNQ